MEPGSSAGVNRWVSPSIDQIPPVLPSSDRAALVALTVMPTSTVLRTCTFTRPKASAVHAVLLHSEPDGPVDFPPAWMKHRGHILQKCLILQRSDRSIRSTPKCPETIFLAFGRTVPVTVQGLRTLDASVRSTSTYFVIDASLDPHGVGRSIHTVEPISRFEFNESRLVYIQ